MKKIVSFAVLALLGLVKVTNGQEMMLTEGNLNKVTVTFINNTHSFQMCINPCLTKKMMMTVSQKEMSLVRSMAIVRGLKCASRTPKVTEPATLVSARNSWWPGPIKRPTPKNTIRSTIMTSALVSTLNAVMLATAKDPTKYALRILMAMVTATSRSVKTFKFQCKRLTRDP
jgi:hypothetical protein